MYIALLFWLALFFPGFALLRRFWSKEIESGLLGVVALSYLGSFAILSPVSILGHLAGAPLALLSAAILVLVLLSLLAITWMGWWKDLGRLAWDCRGVALLGVLVLLADLILGARVGANFRGDAVLHLARVRFLLDHGLSNRDPFIAGDYFFPIYHTNLLHALCASCAQITGLDPQSVWFTALSWGKLLIASGVYYLAFCVFGQRWLGWAAAVFVTAWHGPVDFAIYPNKLAALWLGPTFLGLVVRLCEDGVTRSRLILTALAALIVGQIHLAHGPFLLVAVGPVLLIRAATRWTKNRRHSWSLLIAALSLTLSLPFALAGKYGMKHARSTPGGAAESAESGDDETPEEPDAKAAHPTEPMPPRAGWASFRDWRSWLPLPRRVVDADGARVWRFPAWRTGVLVVGIALALLGPRRRHVSMVLASCLITAAIFYLTPCYSAAVSALGARWLLARMGFLLDLGFVILGAGSILFTLGTKWPFAPLRAALLVLAIPLGLIFVSTNTNGSRIKYQWPAYWQKAKAPASVRFHDFTFLDQFRSFCHKHVPQNEVILTDEFSGMMLAMLHDVTIVAPRRGSNGVPDWTLRRKHLKIILDRNTPWRERLPLLKKYNTQFLFFGTGYDASWARPHTVSVAHEGDFNLVRLDLGPSSD